MALDRLAALQADGDSIETIIDRDIHPIQVEADQEEVARQFERYNLTSAPVVDADQRLVGVITADDVVEVIQEEASEDILRMGGVAGELVTDTVWQTTRHPLHLAARQSRHGHSRLGGDQRCSTRPSSRWWRSPC